MITSELGLELKDTQFVQLGRARQVKVTKENTIIVDGAGEKDKIAGRVSQIRAQLETTTSDFDREKLQERLAKLAGGVAVIKVGAATETEMKEKKLRIEDALNATRAAVEEGVVAGGGTIFVNVIPAVEALLSTVEYDYPLFHLTMHCFLCSLKAGSQPHLLEHEAARWLPVDNMGVVRWLPADVEVVSALSALIGDGR